MHLLHSVPPYSQTKTLVVFSEVFWDSCSVKGSVVRILSSPREGWEELGGGQYKQVCESLLLWRSSQSTDLVLWSSNFFSHFISMFSLEVRVYTQDTKGNQKDFFWCRIIDEPPFGSLKNVATDCRVPPFLMPLNL